MLHTYIITGMTCNGCRASVEEKLNNVDAIIKADVFLDTNEALIKSNKLVTLESLRDALPSKYTIEIKTDFVPALNSKKSELKQLFPLFLIFVYITTAAVLLNSKMWTSSGFMLDFMGLFYIVFSFFKLLDLKGFPESFKMYDPLAKAIPVYAIIYPFIEVILGFMFLMRFQINSALIVTLIILSITTVGVIRTLLNKQSIQCACLGTALKLPMTKATFIENSIMIVMAIVMLLFPA